MQEEKEKSTLRYVWGWILIAIAFFVGFLGYWVGNLFFI